jgi:hypothetical protein
VGDGKAEAAMFTLEFLEGRRLLAGVVAADCNHDGFVDDDDVAIVDAAWEAYVTSGDPATVRRGDLNFDGKINIDDYGIVDGQYGKSILDFVGPSNPSLLTNVSGSISTTQDGQVIENVRLLGGTVFINHHNVTLRNFVSQNPQTTGAAIKFASNDLTGGLIEDGEIFGGNASNGPSGSGYTARRLHIHHMQADAFRVKKDVTIEDCYVHDIGQHPDAHGDGVQMFPTDGGNMRIVGNTFDARGANAALFQVDNGWTVERNSFDGGNFTIQASGHANNFFRNNVFGPHAQFGPIRIGNGDGADLGAWNYNIDWDGDLIQQPD